MEQYDSVRTLVNADEYPAGTLGVISEIAEDGAWVDIYYPDDADAPVDCVFYQKDELRPE